MEGDSETGRAGFLVEAGHTSNQDIWDAFHSVVTETKGSLKLAGEDDPVSHSEVSVRLSDFRYAKHTIGSPRTPR